MLTVKRAKQWLYYGAMAWAFFHFDIPGRTDEQLSRLDQAVNSLASYHHLDSVSIYSSTN